MKKAIYAFSGDPITFGHIDIVERAAKVFDKLIVAIGVNPQKEYTFSLEEREKMAKISLNNLKNVEVVSFKGLLVDFAYENRIDVIVKGLRDEKDFDYEMILHEANRSQKLGIETFLIPAKPELGHISSSTVKALQMEQGIISDYVPLNVKQRLEEKISGQYSIGITGEIGVGKSFVAQKFIELGKTAGINVHNIDLDEVGHRILEDLTEPVYKEARTKIIEKFGDNIAEDNGTINRKKLGEIVFQDTNKLRELNEIMHDLILVRLRREVYGKKGLIIFNAALFAETNMMYLFNNNTLLVSTSKEEQKNRLLKRGMSDVQIQRRLESQFTTTQKEKIILDRIKKDNWGRLFYLENLTNGNSSIQKVFEEITQHFNLAK